MKKYCFIVNESFNLEKFYHKLRHYVVFKKRTIFELKFEIDVTEKLIEELNLIVNALNIKNRKDRIAYIFDNVCDEIDKIFEDKNICGFENDKCYVQRNLNLNKVNGCCRKCYYVSSAGCTSKNIACKLYFCSEVTERFRVCKFEDFKILNMLTFRERLLIKHNYFSCREDILTDLYLGSIFIGVGKMVYRFFKYRLMLKKS